MAHLLLVVNYVDDMSLNGVRLVCDIFPQGQIRHAIAINLQQSVTAVPRLLPGNMSITLLSLI